MEKGTVKMIAVLLLTGFAIWNWWDMNRAETLFEILKSGFEYVASIILLVGATRGDFS